MIEKAILSLKPNSQWILKGDTYSGLEWLDTNQTKPTEAEVTAEIIRLQSIAEANEYKELRAAEYPSYADQFDTIFHQGLEAWKAQIQAVKTKYPKS